MGQLRISSSGQVMIRGLKCIPRGHLVHASVPGSASTPVKAITSGLSGKVLALILVLGRVASSLLASVSPYLVSRWGCIDLQASSTSTGLWFKKMPSTLEMSSPCV